MDMNSMNFGMWARNPLRNLTMTDKFNMLMETRPWLNEEPEIVLVKVAPNPQKEPINLSKSIQAALEAYVAWSSVALW